MPNIIQQRPQSGENVSGSAYQENDYQIAARTGYFNQSKNSGQLDLVTEGGNPIPQDAIKGIPDLDPTLVKAVTVQEPNAGTSGISDIMQANVPGDWSKIKSSYQLTKGEKTSETNSLFAVSKILAHYAGEKGISGYTGIYSGSRGSAITHPYSGNTFFNTKALDSEIYDNAYNIRSTLNHEGGKLGHKNENIPDDKYTFKAHATVYLNEAKHPDFGKATESYRAGQAASFGQRVLNAAQKESSYGNDPMNMINEYNEGNTGSVTIKPYSGGNNLPTSTVLTVSVGNGTYPTKPYEDIKDPRD
ncbi:hypothetical protein [Chryseobacterium taihuense]